MEEGSIESVVARLAYWCRQAPEGIARVEYVSEFARRESLRRLRGQLEAQNVPVQEVELPKETEAGHSVLLFLERLRSFSSGVVSVSGFEAAVHDSDRLPAWLAALNFNRENLARPELRQIWWMPAPLAESFVRSAPDLDSWFALRLRVTELPRDLKEETRLLEPFADRVSPAEARERARALIERARTSLARDMPLEIVQRQLVTPALELLRQADLKQEAEQLYRSLLEEFRKARPLEVPAKVFLSYSHDSPDHRDRVLTLADRLRADGIDAMLDQYEEFPAEGWPRWMDRQIRDADFVLLICTEAYLRRDEMREEPGKGHGVLWEANLIYNALYGAGTVNRKFVPVLLGAAEPSCIPKPLQGYNHYRADTEEGYEALVRLLTGQPETPMPPLGRRKAFPPRERKSVAPPVLWHVPYPRNPFFTGREDVLQRLRDSLAAQGAAALTQTQAISGLGGIGKTQTALEYAYRHRSDYAAVFWLPADSDASLRSAFLAIAAVLDLAAKDAADPAEAVAAVQQWLDQNPHWLLIFDNADQPEVVRPFLPRQGAGHILVTSRAQALQSLHIAAPLSLDPLPADKATEFLLERTGRHEAGPEERRAAEDLARDLGYLPLALEQAGAYIAEKPATFTNYLAAYRLRGAELLSRSQPVAGDYPGSVATTWALNFKEVEKHPASADVLRLSAFLAPDQIPLELLEPAAPKDPLALDELLAPLTRYSLIRRDLDQKTYSLHRLVQEVIKSRMDEPTRRVWAEGAVQAVNWAFPGFQYEDWPRCERLLHHARAAADLIESWGLESAAAGRLLNRAGMYLDERAQLAEAERFLRRALAIGEKLFGLDHPEAATLANNLGTILKAKGDLDGALLYTRRALGIAEKAFGPDHPEVAILANNLGQILEAKGDMNAALLYTRRALAIDEKVLGPDHPNVATDANNLGQILRAKGDLGGALLFTRRALEIGEKVLGPDHPNVATLVSNLGQILRAKGDLDGALLHIRRALEIGEKVLGPDHPNVATLVNNLGQILQDKGDLDGALLYTRRALEIDEKVFGPDHPEVAALANNLGGILQAKGDLDGALLHTRRALAIDEKVYGPHHPNIAIRANNLGSILRAKGDLDGALLYSRRALAIDEKVFGPDHPNVARDANNLGSILQDRGDLEGALPNFRRALEIFTGAYGPDHSKTKLAARNLSLLEEQLPGQEPRR